MKGKILTLIIGILIGAIIATAGFLVYTKINEKSSKSNNSNFQMMMKDKRDKPNKEGDNKKGDLNGEDFENFENPPQIPNEKMQDEEPPELPTQNNSNKKLQNSNI